MSRQYAHAVHKIARTENNRHSDIVDQIGRGNQKIKTKHLETHIIVVYLCALLLQNTHANFVKVATFENYPYSEEVLIV